MDKVFPLMLHGKGGLFDLYIRGLTGLIDDRF